MAIVRTLFLLAVAAALGACDSPRQYADAHDLGVAAQQVESLAREAGWLAQELQADHVSAKMAWVHQAALAEDAAKALQDLGKPVPPALRAQQEAVAKLAAQLQLQVTRIAPAATDPGELESLQRAFKALAQSAHPIAQQA